MTTLRGLMVLNEEAARMVYGPEELRDIARHVALLAPAQTRKSLATQRALLADADALFSGWGGPVLDEEFLDAAPRLRVVFYGAGSLASIVTDAVWERGVTVTTAAAANAVPVAEYTLATMLFSLKHGWRLARQVRATHNFPDRNTAPGCYRSTVGIISLGAVARKLIELLKPFDLDVLIYDPFLSSAQADALGVKLSSLDEVFARSAVVSLHAPQLPETIGMIAGRHFASMPSGATFINTARAEIVRQDELVAVAEAREDLQFVLDVAHPEPPAPGSPLYTLPNVVLTPHMAGSVGAECRRMGRYMVEELERFVAGRPLKWAVTSESIKGSAHQPWWTATPRPVSKAKAITSVAAGSREFSNTSTFSQV